MPNSTTKPYTIVFIRLEPGSKENLALQGEECKRILQTVQESGLFHVADLEGRPFGEIVSELNKIEPDIIHLSGHGGHNALLMPNFSSTDKGKAKASTFLSQEQIDDLFKYALRRSKPCILFINACLAGGIANKIQESLGSDSKCCTIGMTNVLHQQLALRFAEAFYGAISNGDTVGRILADLFPGVIVAAKKDLRKTGEDGLDPQPRVYGNIDIKFDGGLDIDWHEVSRKRLEERLQLTANWMTNQHGVGYQVQQVFVPLGLVERKNIPRRTGDVHPEQGSELYQAEAEETEVTQKFEHTQFLEQVLRRGQSPKSQGKRIAIIGEPGAGKTTLLQQIAQWVLTEFPESIVIWVSLAELQDQEKLETYLESWLKGVIREAGDEVSPSYTWQFTAQFRQGRVWLLLDGLDEIQVAGNPLSYIQRQIREGGWLQQARILLTCRLNLWDGNRNSLARFDTYRTLEFVYPNQVEQFIGRWFAPLRKEDWGQKLCTALKEPDKERIRDLVKNPLRLTLMCVDWSSGAGELPETQAALYQNYVTHVVKWWSEKFGKSKFDLEPEPVPTLNQALAELAKAAIDDQDIDWQARFRLRQTFVQHYINTSLLESALELGLLNQIGMDAEPSNQKVYAFYHTTFQEYFAALAIPDKDFFLKHACRNPDAQDASYRIFEPQWKQVFLLWLGRKGGELEQDPERKTQEQIKFKKQKETLIQALVTFKDECKGIYSDIAFVLAAEGIAEFKDCKLIGI